MTTLSDPGEDLAQFRALATSLPFVKFDAGGAGHPRINLFAATGRAAEVEAVMGQVADLPFDAAFTQAVSRADADLRLYELDLANPSTALGETLAARTVTYGMMAIETGPDLFALASLNDAHDEINLDDPLAALASSCRRDVCAILGAVMAARMAGLPVIADGVAVLRALEILHALNDQAVTHCAVPMGSAIEGTALRLGAASLRCNDTRPLHALAATILAAKALVISG